MSGRSKRPRGSDGPETYIVKPTTTLLKRLPTLDEVANAAVFLASDQAGAMTAAIANLSCGALVD